MVVGLVADIVVVSDRELFEQVAGEMGEPGHLESY